jgi:spore germination cell wall hydrolase CwlJ-like protein
MKPIQEQTELILLALCIWGEARGESKQGKEAVAHVVMNRYKHPKRFGKTVKEVILRPKQFSCFNAGSSSKDKMLSIPADDVWTACLSAAQSVYLGKVKDNTMGATHYCRHDCFPSWRKKMTQTTKIGDHVFFVELI